MNRLICLAVCVLGACHEVTAPFSNAWIRGTIRIAGPNGLSGQLAYLVVAPGGDTACIDHMRAQVQLAPSTKLFWRDASRAQASDLKVGQEVSVWITGIVIDLCPPVVNATNVVIESTS
jgi:hypothetical protein